MTHHIHGFRQQQFRVAGAVATAAFFFQDLQNIGVGGGLYCKVFLKTGIPAEGGLQIPGPLPDTGFVVNVERGGNLLDDFPGLFQCQK